MRSSYSLKRSCAVLFALALWARLWSEVGGAWSWQEISFTVGPVKSAYFSYPQNGSTSVDPSNPFIWYPAPNATSYVLDLGTTRGGTDLLNSGSLTTTS